MSASYCFVLHGRCIAPRVRDSIFAEHQRPQVAAFMECVDFMQPSWRSRISTFNLSRWAMKKSDSPTGTLRPSRTGPPRGRSLALPIRRVAEGDRPPARIGAVCHPIRMSVERLSRTENYSNKKVTAEAPEESQA